MASRHGFGRYAKSATGFMLKLYPVRWPPPVLGVLYLFWIPFFALIYTHFLGDQFYHSTLRYEPSLEGEAEDAIDALQSAIVQNFRNGHGGDEAMAGEWRIQADSLKVSFLHPTQDSMTFTMWFDAVKATAEGSIEGVLHFAFDATYDISRKGPVMVMGGQGEPPLYYRPLSFEPQVLTLPAINEKIDYEVFFPPPSGSLSPLLALPPETDERLHDFWRASQGLPSHHQCWRMLYLSSMTATTVGYGDIVPLTGKARAAVAVEAILGVATAGLFLNSLFQRRRQSSGRLSHKRPC